MKILIVTDAWEPQINGVVKTLQFSGRELQRRGHEVVFLSPSWPGLKNFPLPTYPEIQLPWNLWRIPAILRDIAPDAIHIATEGTLGVVARAYCNRRKLPFTTAYHTKLPEYINARCRWVRPDWVYRYMRWLHRYSRAVLVTTATMKAELESKSLHPKLVVWSRGVDLDLFRPRAKRVARQRLRLLYVGRIAVGKNLEAFLRLPDSLGDKVLVGDGPDRQQLEARFTDASFSGYRHGAELVAEFAAADCFVFPSRTDTFGIVMLEANACATPVAAYPVAGPLDFIVDGVNGYLHEDLAIAVRKCLALERQPVRDHVEENYSWRRATDVLEQALVLIK